MSFSKLAGWGVLFAAAAVPGIQTAPILMGDLEGKINPAVTNFHLENVMEEPNGDFVATVYLDKRRACKPAGDHTITAHAEYDGTTHHPVRIERLDFDTAIDNPTGDHINVGRWRFVTSRIDARPISVFIYTNHKCGPLWTVRTKQRSLPLTPENKQNESS